MKDLGLMMALVSERCLNEFKLYDICFQIHEGKLMWECEFKIRVIIYMKDIKIKYI